MAPLHSSAYEHTQSRGLIFFLSQSSLLDLRNVTQKNLQLKYQTQYVSFHFGGRMEKRLFRLVWFFFLLFSSRSIGKSWVPQVYLHLHLNHEVMSFSCLFQTVFFGKCHNIVLIWVKPEGWYGNDPGVRLESVGEVWWGSLQDSLKLGDNYSFAGFWRKCVLALLHWKKLHGLYGSSAIIRDNYKRSH